jgi:hypothetical protein
MFCSICLLSIPSSSFKVDKSSSKIWFCYFYSLVPSSKVLIPQIIYADSTINHDEDDDLIDPGVNTLIDPLTNDRLDAQFEDITASTNIIQPLL